MKYLILFFCLLLSSNTLLRAEATTVTNSGNVPVRVEYKGDKGDYQETHLNPGETKELPGGMEKVKLSREKHGEGAKGTKPGEEIKVDVKEDGQNVGTLNGYGDKLIFDQVTQAPQTAVQISPSVAPKFFDQESKPVDNPANSPAGGRIQLKDNFVKVHTTTPTKEAEQTQLAPKSDQQPGTVHNTGQPMVHVTYKDGSGNVIKQTVISGGGTDKIPPGTESVEVQENMIQSGYRFPHLNPDPEVTIHHEDGKIETVKDLPPAYEGNPKSVPTYQSDYFKGAKFQTNPFGSFKLDYKYGPNSSPSSGSNQPDSRNMDRNFNDDLGRKIRYEF